MKTLSKVIIFLLFFTNLCYADNNNSYKDTEYTDSEEYNFEDNSIESSTETHERSEYNIEMKDIVSVRYTSTKTIIEHK